MTARVQQSLRDPNLGEGVVQRLRDEFGADSQVASDNVIVLMFAGAWGDRQAGSVRPRFDWLLHGVAELQQVHCGVQQHAQAL